MACATRRRLNKCIQQPCNSHLSNMHLAALSSPRGQGLTAPPSILDRSGQDQTDRHAKIRQFKTTLRGTLSRGIIDDKQYRAELQQMYRCLNLSASILDLEVDADGSSSHGSTASTSCDISPLTPPGSSPVAVVIPEAASAGSRRGSFSSKRHSSSGQDIIGCWEESDYMLEGDVDAARSTFSADKVVLDGNSYVILFGGFNGKPLDDVLVFDQDSETFSSPKCTVKPGSSMISARYSHTATVWNQKLVVFGGWSGSRCNDLYVLDCLTWEWEEIKPQQPASSMPSGRAGHTATLFGDHLVIFGGNDGELLNDVWILCLKSMLWHKTGSGGIPISGTPPFPVSSHSATKFSDLNGEYILFFGQKHEDQSIMYSHTHMLRFDIRRDSPQSEPVFSIRWTSKEASGNKPGMRYAHTACKYRQKLIVFGGVSVALRNDVWILDTESWTWYRPTIIGKSPLARFGHCSWLSDVKQGQVMIFGGKHRSEILCDLHSIEFSSTVTLEKILNQIEATVDNFMQEELSELDKCQQILKEQVSTACNVVEKALRHRHKKFSEDLNLIYLPMLRKSFHNAATGPKENMSICKQSCRVKLNVGGGLFETTSRTLCAVTGSLLYDYGEAALIDAAAAANGASAAGDANNATIFIDRSPRLFDTILNYLRDTADAIDVQFSLGQADLQALMREAQYYRLNDLRTRISEQLSLLGR